MSGWSRPARFLLLAVALVLTAVPGGAAGADTTTTSSTTTSTTTTSSTTTPGSTTTTTAGFVTPTTLPTPAPGSLSTGPPAGPASPVDPGPPGYWMVASDGGIFSFGSARFAGSTGGLRLTQPVVGMLPTPTGRGYRLAAADGGIFAFGDAGFAGSAAGRPPGAPPFVGIAGTPTGAGYWLFAVDGAVYSFGDATFFGRVPPSALHAPIVAAASTPDGRGYWLAAADGSVYPLGDAAVVGDASRLHLARPIVGMAVTPTGRGYWLVAGDGGIFTYGDAAFFGSTGALHLNQPIVTMSSSTTGRGYWLFAGDGGVFAFGDAPFLGSTGNLRLVRPVVGARQPAAAHGTTAAIFFYPWYASAPHDGYWRHWDEGGHIPPDDVGSDFYPARGAYSSTDPAVLEGQMGDIASIGIPEAIVSWWGQGSFEDNVLPAVVAAARDHGVKVGVQVEPYPNRSSATVLTDYAYLSRLGVTDVWVYQADEMSAAGLAADNDAFPGLRTLAESGDLTFVRSGAFARWAWGAHFTGVYLYDAYDYEAGDLPPFCGAAHRYGLICAPVAAPGFSAVRATGGSLARARLGGATYDWRWGGAIGARPDLVAITSYNEWHEGSQIEPAVPKCLSATFCYRNYDFAYGAVGVPGSFAYLNRTGYWTGQLAALNP